MPAGLTIAPQPAERFDVIGEKAGATARLTHLGLLVADGSLNPATAVSVFDMGIEIRLSPPGEMLPHAFGTLSLSRDEMELLDAWVQNISTQVRDVVYIALPAWLRDVDEDTGRPAGWRFSCAGWVQRAYLVLGIRLIEDSLLPHVTFDVVLETWRHVLRAATGGYDPPEEKAREILSWFGLIGPGPWRVLLPGYVLRAFEQPRSNLPYAPREDDRDFP